MPSMDGLRATRRIKAARSAKVIKLPRPWLLLALALSVASPASAQAPGTWAPIADLNQPRAEHTATLLANGTVLIAGGRDAADQALASAEIYDPATGGYTLLASPLPAPIWGHTATRLDDGTVLIAGGRRGASPRRAAQLFDPATDTFTALGPMSTPRGRHTATLLRDGRVVVIGGTDGVGPLASLELYDPTRRTFSRAPSALTVARQDHTATLLPDGRVLVAGGSNASGALDSAELYDPTAGTVSPAGPLNVPRTLASAALLLDGTVLVAGGQTTTSEDLDSAEVYDAATNTFAWLAAPMGTTRSGHLGVQLLHNGKVLISGGTSGGQLVANAEVYDPITGAFQPVDSPGTARRLFGANFFEVPYTGILLASGGFDASDQPLASSEVFFYPTLRSDKPDYAPGETVTLMGEGWRPNEQVAINIRESSGDPDTNVTATADASGAFTNSEFQTNPDRSDVGVRFLTTATGQTSGWTAQTVFKDASTDFTQCRNDSNNDGVKDLCSWSSGAINANNSIYTEGNSVPQRLFQTIDTAGTHSIRFRHRFTKDSKYAYDFLTNVDATQSGLLLNECGDLPGFVSASACSTLFSNALLAPIPSDSFDAVASRETPSVRNIRVGGVSSASVSIVGHDPSSSCFQNCGDSTVDVQITFATTANNATVAVWFGGHLAAGFDPPGPPLGWGTGFGASSISGAPFHISFVRLDDGAIGNRDNAIQPSAVVPPSTIIVQKNTVGGDDTFNYTATGADIPGSFSITTSSGSGSQTFSGLVPGSYSISEVISGSGFPTGWTFTTLTCTSSGTGTSATTSGATANITLGAAGGGTVTCTYINTKGAAVIVKKVMVGGTGTFTYSGTPSGAISTNNGTITASVAPGQYTSTETVPAGWALTSISCDDTNSTGNVGTATATFNAEAGETVTCTFTNTKGAAVIVKKVMVGGTGTFTYSGTPSGAISTNNGTITASVAERQSAAKETGPAAGA